MNFTARDIYEKEFRRSKDKGYDIEDVNSYLDLVIEDYMEVEKKLIRLKELEIENQNLKIKISALKNASPEEEVSTTLNTNHIGNTNLDILKRISRLEQAVFGKNND